MVSHKRANRVVGPVAASGGRRVGAVTSSAAAVGIAAAVCAPATSQALTVQSVTAQVQSLRAQSEIATQRYDRASQDMAALQQKVDAIQSTASTIQLQVNKYYGSLGQLAETQYRGAGVDPTLQLMFAQQPDEFLQRAVSLQSLSRGESVGLKRVLQQQQQLVQFRAEASQAMEQQADDESRAAAARAQILAGERQAQALLDQLTSAQRWSMDYAGITPQEIANLPQPAGRAATAVDFAESKLGMWYQWGGTGDPSYDCSGLVQAAWAAAGVQLPRVTWDQIDAGQAVSPDPADLQPGDLIFYLGGAHVAMYVGNGLVIHAPTTGQRIQYGRWNMMPVTAARQILPTTELSS
ncbi:C40 family peptidase [Actinospica sp. MGRD01-02]|uniref:C40 family peptidase n=1 Tax=Actinospica acidithermotolerans TaxID=2828514 RepID=A0A941E7Q7_9ACTN|nr:C40 family peptidase [Actinospica acidithermotolerans]MBR7826037.1 C40 family peptidase [Actinospica acidithermotolerans]